MGKRTDVEVYRDYRRWRERLTDNEFRELPFVRQGKELGVSPTTISKWHKELSPAQWENIRKMTIERVAPQSVKINDALYRKCLEGDVQAIKLWKESIEGWVPRSDMGLSRARDRELDAMANDDLVKMLVKDWPQDKKLAILSGGGGDEPLVGDGASSVDPGDSDGELEEWRRREAEAAKELKEMTGGEFGVGEEREEPRRGLFTKDDFKKDARNPYNREGRE